MLVSYFSSNAKMKLENETVIILKQSSVYMQSLKTHFVHHLYVYEDKEVWSVFPHFIKQGTRTIWCNINVSNKKNRVWPHFQTPRRELKVQRIHVAVRESFLMNFKVFGNVAKTVLSVGYIYIDHDDWTVWASHHHLLTGWPSRFFGYDANRKEHQIQ